MTGEQFEEELYRENLYFVYEDKCKELEKELENLKKIEKEHQRINGELREENKDLQQRIENSIDFINGGKGWRKLRYTHQEKMLLNILKGSDKE